MELSYLPEKAQTYLLEEIRSNDCTPSLSQAIRMKKLYQTGSLSPEDISTIMQEEKANQQEKVSFKTGDLRKFFPKSYSAAQMQETILKRSPSISASGNGLRKDEAGVDIWCFEVSADE